MSISTPSHQSEPVSLEWGQTWPPRDVFVSLAASRRVIPVVRRVLADELSAVGVYRQLAHGNYGSFILESAEHGGSWGRWSFVGASSAGAIVARDGRARWVGSHPEGAREEGTAATAPKEADVPDATLVLATEVAAIDHSTGSVYLMAIAWNLNGSDEGVDGAYDRAIERLDAMTTQLASPIAPAVLGVSGQEPPAVRERTQRADFESSVNAAKRAITDGDAFQIVLSQRLDVATDASGVDVYRVLRTVNPSPYMYYLDLPDERGGHYEVVGSSPETLVKAQGRRVWTYPIAGSRPRGADSAQDHRLAAELLEDPKELSEHVMLVDLARNDLSKVCDPASVEVATLMELKRYSHIQHISSTVTGLLRPDADALDALVATFPAGTLSGAPKPRAIQLIDDFEPAARGVYGGVVGYFDLSGDADLAIAIRTAALKDGVASVQAGAGVVADSVPALEYEESRNKAAAAVESVVRASTLTALS